MNSAIQFHVGADTTNFKNGMAEVRAVGNRTASAVDRAMLTMGARVTAALTAVAGVAGSGVAFKEAITVAAEGVKRISDFSGAMSDLSAKTGLSVAQAVTFERAFRLAGLSSTQVGSSIARLQKAMQGVNEEGEPTNAAFEKLGLSIFALQAMTPAAAFEAVSTAIANLGTASARTKAAMDIFGKSGAELLVLFRDASIFDVARRQVGGLANELELGSGALDKISDSLEGLEAKKNQFFAGALGGFTGDMDNAAALVDQIDLTEPGRQVGFFIRGTAEIANNITAITNKAQAAIPIASALSKQLASLFPFLNAGVAVATLPGQAASSVASIGEATAPSTFDRIQAGIKPPPPPAPAAGVTAPGVTSFSTPEIANPSVNFGASVFSNAAERMLQTFAALAPTRSPLTTTLTQEFRPKEIGAFNRLQAGSSSFDRLQASAFGSGAALKDSFRLRSASLIAGEGNLDTLGFRPGRAPGSFRLPTREEKKAAAAAEAEKNRQKNETLVGTNEALGGIKDILEATLK
jgi:hypothetical protein